MKVKVIRIVALIPTRAGCAVFLGDEDKIMQFFIDLQIGAAINAHLSNEPFERPFTHDLFSQSLDMFGVKMTKMIITDYQNDIYYARVHLEMKNALEERKSAVMDSRPSDALALAVRQGAPILIDENVWEEVEDMSQLLEDLKKQADDGEDEEGDSFGNEEEGV